MQISLNMAVANNGQIIQIMTLHKSYKKSRGQKVINSFLANAFILYSLKTPENPSVFGG